MKNYQVGDKGGEAFIVVRDVFSRKKRKVGV